MAFHSCVKRTYCVHAAYMPRTCIQIICHVFRFDYYLSFIQQFGLNPQFICEGVQSFLSASLHCYAVISFRLPANALPITSEVGFLFITTGTCTAFLPGLSLVPVLFERLTKIKYTLNPRVPIAHKAIKLRSRYVRTCCVTFAITAYV